MSGHLPTDPEVLILAGLAVLWLATAVLAWLSIRKLRRELSAVAAKAAGSVDDLGDVFEHIDSLGGMLQAHDDALYRQRVAEPVEPVTLSIAKTDPSLAWVDVATGPQPIVNPPTNLIPRATPPAPKTELIPVAATDPKPTTGPIDAYALIARLRAEQKQREESK
jgi:hypothetical protein